MQTELMTKILYLDRLSPTRVFRASCPMKRSGEPHPLLSAAFPLALVKASV